MNKYELFAANHFLFYFDPSLEFHDLLLCVKNNERDSIIIRSEINLHHEEVAEDIENFAAYLEEKLSNKLQHLADNFKINIFKADEKRNIVNFKRGEDLESFSMSNKELNDLEYGLQNLLNTIRAFKCAL